jgi:predicted Zn finger-like uncharacterized protein
MQTLTIACPACGRPLRVPESLLGQMVKCPSCLHTFAAPDSLGEVPPPGPPEAVREPEPPPRPRDDDRDDYRERVRRRPADEDWDEDEEDYRPGRRGGDKPGKVQAIAIMTLVGGIHALLVGLVGLLLGVSTCVCLLWPGTYYSIVLGILAVIKGSQLLGSDAHRQAPPQAIAIMQIVNIVNGDVPNCVMGILTLVFLSEKPIARFFRGR